jgi:hypothetical protein
LNKNLNYILCDINHNMKIQIEAQEDENFKFVKYQEQDIQKEENNFSVDVVKNNVIEESQSSKVIERRQPTLENPKGHEWFNGTSWGLK